MGGGSIRMPCRPRGATVFRTFRNGCRPCGENARLNPKRAKARRFASSFPCPKCRVNSVLNRPMTTVAIIEDNNTMRKMLTELVDSASGYRCICACSTSKEAFVEVPKHHPNVVLMDIH